MEIFLELLPTVAAIAVLLACSAFFSGSETALMLLSRSQVKRMVHGTFTERVVYGLLQNSKKLLATVLVGNMIVNVLLTALCASLLAQGVIGTESSPGLYGRFLVPALKWCGLSLSESGWDRFSEIFSMVLNVAIVTPLLMVFGEMSPKSYAFHHSGWLARVAAVPLLYISKLLSPVLWFLHGIIYVIQTIFRMPQGKDWDMLTTDEVSAMLSAGRAEGATSEQEKELLERLLRFGTIDVKEIMIPRTQVTGVDDSMTLAEAAAAVRRSTHNYLPVYHEDFDDIWAVASYAQALSWSSRPDAGKTLAEFRGALEKGGGDLPVQEVNYAPAVAKVNRVLEDMQQKNHRFLVVVGEYGGTLGILTINDILAEIIGRFSTGRGHFDYLHPRADGSWLADGRIALRKLRDCLNEDEFTGEADRLSGYIMETLERLPVTGDSVQTKKFRYTVIRMNGKRVGVVQICPLEAPRDQEESREAAEC